MVCWKKIKYRNKSTPLHLFETDRFFFCACLHLRISYHTPPHPGKSVKENLSHGNHKQSKTRATCKSVGWYSFLQRWTDRSATYSQKIKHLGLGLRLVPCKKSIHLKKNHSFELYPISVSAMDALQWMGAVRMRADKNCRSIAEQVI